MKQGKSGNPNGRPKGIPNKATIQAREAIADFVEGNVDRLNGWLDLIAEKDPQKAFDSFMSVVEYHIPKLARAEHVGDGGGAIKVEGKIDLTSQVLKHIPSEVLQQIVDATDHSDGKPNQG